MYVSYQKLTQVTRLIAFPIPLCGDSVQDINIEANYSTDVDIDSGYWKVVLEEEAFKILALFTPDGNQLWKVIPMGSLNADPTLLAMMMKLQM